MFYSIFDNSMFLLVETWKYNADMRPYAGGKSAIQTRK